jgi:hypothetical protein
VEPFNPMIMLYVHAPHFDEEGDTHSMNPTILIMTRFSQINPKSRSLVILFLLAKNASCAKYWDA